MSREGKGRLDRGTNRQSLPTLTKDPALAVEKLVEDKTLDTGLGVIPISPVRQLQDMEGTESRVKLGSQGHGVLLGKLAHCYHSRMLGASTAE